MAGHDRRCPSHLHKGPEEEGLQGQVESYGRQLQQESDDDEDDSEDDDDSEEDVELGELQP
eukprot:16187667-Heterocapsa_arctica.AAC.1